MGGICYDFGMAKTAITHRERSKRRQRIAASIERGKLGVHQAAKRYGVSVQMVRLACKEHGTVARTTATQPLGRSAYRVLADLINTDTRVAMIAERRGVTVQYVDNVRKRAQKVGIELNPNRKARR